MFFLCGGGGKPACPNSPATVTGTVNASNIIGPAGQGVAPGEFEEAITAMRDGAAYANVHTVVYDWRNSRTDQPRAILARFCSISLTSFR